MGPAAGAGGAAPQPVHDRDPKPLFRHGKGDDAVEAEAVQAVERREQVGGGLAEVAPARKHFDGGKELRAFGRGEREQSDPLSRSGRRLRGERLEDRMVLSTAPVPVQESLAEYMAHDHQMGPVAPADVAVPSDADLQQLAALYTIP